jgi:hypothetical protein
VFKGVYVRVFFPVSIDSTVTSPYRRSAALTRSAGVAAVTGVVHGNGLLLGVHPVA